MRKIVGHGVVVVMAHAVAGVVCVVVGVMIHVAVVDRTML
jgi:hypothetical protein